MPILAQYCNRTRLILIQDNAKGYAIKATLQYIREYNLIPIFWPTNSPDLNPIKTLQYKTKDYIQEKYPDIYRSYLQLRVAVCKAWNSIIEEDIQDLIKSIYNRCQAVIDAEGQHTKYQVECRIEHKAALACPRSTLDQGCAFLSKIPSRLFQYFAKCLRSNLYNCDFRVLTH